MQREVKKSVRKNYKLMLGFVIGAVVSGIGVYAATTLSSSNISYDNSKSGLTSTNLNGAIDELYEKSKKLSSSKPCRVLKGTGKETSDEIKCGTEEFYVLFSSGDSISVLTKYPIEAGHASFDIENYEMKNIIEIESPSYAQNKNCGRENFRCGGTGFSSEYKAVLNKIGLSNSIEVVKPSLSELNKAGCSFVLNPSAGRDAGSCTSLSWLSNVVVTDIVEGPYVHAIANSDGLDGIAQLNTHYGEDAYEKLIIKIPITNILM